MHYGYAATYFVSTAGNDFSGNGSASNPWKTLYKALTTVTTPGNTIHVKAGEYIETVQISLAPGVNLEGEGINTIIKTTINKDWGELLSLRSPEGTNGNQQISFLKFDGQNLSTFWGIVIAGRSNVSIHDCSIVDFSDRGVIFAGRSDNQDAAPEIFATGNTFYNNIVNNCAAYNTNTGKYGRGCLNIGGQDGMLIYNNTITQNQRPVGYNGFAIKYCNDGYLKGIKIYNNKIIKAPFMGKFGGDEGWDFAMEFWNVLGGMEIYGNNIQGAVDFVKTSKETYDFSVWFHNNTLGQQVLNKHFESGLIFEFYTDAVIIENNVFNKIAGGVIFYSEGNRGINNITIRNNRFENIGSKNGDGNNGNGIHIGKGVVMENEASYYIDNLSIYNNSFIAAENNAPLYGIEISGAESAKKISIINNTIKGFVVAPVFANPGFVIDSLLIENNTLAGNGNGNKPFFISGTPGIFTFKNNKQDFSLKNPGYNFKQQFLRPLYYEIKATGIPQYVAIGCLFIALWFCSKEKIYTYLFAAISLLISLLLFLEKEMWAESFTIFSFIAVGFYGWRIWQKRDKRRHRIVRVSKSSKKDIRNQIGFFGGVFIALLLIQALISFNQVFTTSIITKTVAYCTALTGMWLIANKKIEGWYWWLLASIISLVLFYTTYYLLYSIATLLLILAIGWCFYAWKKRLNRKSKVSSVTTLS